MQCFWRQMAQKGIWWWLPQWFMQQSWKDVVEGLVVNYCCYDGNKTSIHGIFTFQIPCLPTSSAHKSRRTRDTLHDNNKRSTRRTVDRPRRASSPIKQRKKEFGRWGGSCWLMPHQKSQTRCRRNLFWWWGTGSKATMRTEKQTAYPPFIQWPFSYEQIIITSAHSTVKTVNWSY